MKARFTKWRGERGIPFHRKAQYASVFLCPCDSTRQLSQGNGHVVTKGAILTSRYDTQAAVKEVGDTFLAALPIRLAYIYHKTDLSMIKCCIQSEPSPMKRPKEIYLRSEELRYLSELKSPTTQIESSVNSNRRLEAS